MGVNWCRGSKKYISAEPQLEGEGVITSRRQNHENAERRTRAERRAAAAVIREEERVRTTTDSFQPTLPSPIQDNRGDTGGDLNPAGLTLEHESVLDTIRTSQELERVEEEEAPGRGIEE